MCTTIIKPVPVNKLSFFNSFLCQIYLKAQLLKVWVMGFFRSAVGLFLQMEELE